MNEIGNAIYNGLTGAVAEVDPDRLITKALIVMEYIDDEGERALAVYGSPDIRGWDIDALAGYASKVADEIERAEIRELMAQ